MKIIDFELKGNQVLFYLGADNCNNYWGDDWDDRPYEHNAERVYGEFVIGTFVKTFDFHDVVMEPCSGEHNSNYSKEDMIKRRVPCICVLPKEYKDKDTWYYSFSDISNNEKTIKFYFGDVVDETQENIQYIIPQNHERKYLSINFAGSARLKDIVSKLLKEQLFAMFADRYGRQFDEENCSILKTKTKSDYKKMITKLIEANAILFTKEEIDLAKNTLTLDFVDKRVKDTMNVCISSKCVFDIGEVKYY